MAILIRPVLASILARDVARDVTHVVSRIVARALASAPAIALAALPAAAQDADGATLFSRRCASCHVVQATDGTLLAGRAAQTGPNLYGIAGRPAASVGGFAYGEGLAAWGAAGGAWDEAAFTAYVQDPGGFLAAASGVSEARSRMAFQLRDPGEAAAIWVFLAQAGSQGRG